MLEDIVSSIKKASGQFFETMCPLPFEECDVIRDTSAMELGEGYDLVAVVAITGDCKGSISVHLPTRLAQSVARQMLGLEDVDQESDIVDMAGELSNMIAGGAKTIISSVGINFDISCPTVIKGCNSGAVPSSSSETALLHFKAESIPFAVLVSVVKKS